MNVYSDKAVAIGRLLGEMGESCIAELIDEAHRLNPTPKSTLHKLKFQLAYPIIRNLESGGLVEQTGKAGASRKTVRASTYRLTPRGREVFQPDTA